MLIAVVLLWSFGYSSARYSLTHGWEPLQFSGVRFILGALIFSVVALVKERSLRIDRGDLIYLLPAGLLGIVVNQITFNIGLSLTTAATVALIFGTLPVFAAVLTSLLGWERLGVRHWVATGVSFAGVALVAVGTDADLSGGLGGILLALGAVLTFAIFSVSVLPLMRKYSVYRVTAVVTIAGTVPLALISLPQMLGDNWAEIEPLAWGGFVYQLLMFVGTSYLWFVVINRVGASHATIWVNMQPFVGAVFAVIILSETLGSLQIAGAIVIAFSIVLASWRRLGQVPAA